MRQDPRLERLVIVPRELAARREALVLAQLLVGVHLREEPARVRHVASRADDVSLAGLPLGHGTHPRQRVVLGDEDVTNHATHVITLDADEPQRVRRYVHRLEVILLDLREGPVLLPPAHVRETRLSRLLVASAQVPRRRAHERARGVQVVAEVRSHLKKHSGEVGVHAAVRAAAETTVGGELERLVARPVAARLIHPYRHRRLHQPLQNLRRLLHRRLWRTVVVQGYHSLSHGGHHLVRVESVRLDVHDNHVEEPEEEVLRQVDVSPTPALLVTKRLSHVRRDDVQVLVHLILLLAGELAIVGIGIVQRSSNAGSFSPRASGARAEIVALAVVAVIELDRHAGQTERVAVPAKPAYSRGCDE